MRVAFLLALLVVLAGCTSDAPAEDNRTTTPDPEPGPTVGGAETWFLHSSDEACDGSGATFMDKTDRDDGGADGCGAVGTAGLGGGFVVEFPSLANSTGAAGDAPLAGSIFLQFTNPGQYTVDVALRAGGKTVGSASVTEVAASAYGGVTPWTEFAFETTSDAVEPDTKLTFSITVSDSASYFVGYDGDHASQFTLG